MNVPPVIRVRNGQRKIPIAIEPLERFAAAAFLRCCALPTAELECVRALPEIGVTLVSDRRIAALHRRFMNLAGPTDVLTFQHGEIVVSVETAQQNARRFGSTTEDEIRLYIVHGFLHLLGFDDRTLAQSRVMEAAQKKILRLDCASNDR